MKRILLILLILFPALLLSAQDQVIPNGYYRVHNKKTQRYVYICDNTAKIDFVAVTADMGAIQLWNKEYRDPHSDPASVVYLQNIGTSTSGPYYNLSSQGTGIKQLINYYVYILSYKPANDSEYYQLYAEGKYLCDNESSSLPSGALGYELKGDYRKWISNTIDANSDEWFGIKATINGQDRYLHPFYADFGFSCIPTGMKVWYIKAVDKEGAVIKEITDNVIPASTPVFIECVSPDAQDNKLNLIYSNTAGPQDNKLKGVYFNNQYRNKSSDARTEFDKNTMRVLGVMEDGRLGYVLSKVKPDQKTKKQYLEANQSYLMVGADIPDEIPLITEAEYNDILAQREALEVGAVSDVLRLYNVFSISGEFKGRLSQDEIDQLPSGIYIVDNRKVVID